MHTDHYLTLIKRAVQEDGETLVSIARQLEATTVALGILRAKGYGTQGMMIDATARAVPEKD